MAVKVHCTHTASSFVASGQTGEYGVERGGIETEDAPHPYWVLYIYHSGKTGDNIADMSQGEREGLPRKGRRASHALQHDTIFVHECSLGKATADLA